MGLDMYLTKETYIGAEYAHRQIDGTIFITKEGKRIPINFNQISEITESVAYWRKANAIHKWFVDNVQEGQDDCGKYRVTIEQLKQLVKICKTVLKDHSKAGELLPPQSGFFFGSTDIDEWYFEDLKSTIKQLTPIIKDYPSEDFDVTIYYQSSW
jgi:hypothetical protein